MQGRDLNDPRLEMPQFLTDNQLLQAEKEVAKLETIGNAPNVLGQVVLDWARAHAADQRVPKALYLVVKATRYGCTNDETVSYSKAAFDLLHRRYPNNEWAHKTRYYFKQ